MKFTALTNLYNKDKIENGDWCHLTGPDDEPIYLVPATDKEPAKFPARFKVRSILSQAYEDHMDAVQKDAANKARRLKGDKQRDAMLAELKKERPKSFAALVTEVENIDEEKPGEGGKPSKLELMEFAADPSNRPYVDQALEHAADSRHYGGENEPAVVESKKEPTAD